MTNLSFRELKIERVDLENLLDDPVKEFLKSDTIDSILKRVYNFVSNQIVIDEMNKLNVIDAIYAIASWECNIIYGNSISKSIRLDDIGAYTTNINHLRMLAEKYAALIGVDLDRKTENTYNSPLPTCTYGNSMV